MFSVLERASGEWRVLLLALVIGVGSVTTTGFLGDRLQRAMRDEGARFLGADLLVTRDRDLLRLAHSRRHPAPFAIVTPEQAIEKLSSTKKDAA